MGAACVLPFLPFLAYAGLAITNVSAQWANSVSRYQVGPVVGAICFVMWLVLALGVPVGLGYLVGAGVHRLRGLGRVA